MLNVKSLFLALLMFCGLPSAAYANDLPDALLNAPIYLISGQTVSLADYKGKKPVYLKFWATWCQPCRQQMAHFESVQKRYGDTIEIIAINLGLNDDLASVQKAIKEFGLTMPMAIDKDGDLAQKFHLIGTPYHLLFDKEMNLVNIGHNVDDSLDNKLALLANSKTTDVLSLAVLKETAADIPLNLNDGKLHALFFSATWCDWYWKDSVPAASKDCVAGQQAINTLFDRHPEIVWQGVMSRLWAGDKDLKEYIGKFKLKNPVAIDQSNRLFHRYNVDHLPTLLLIKNGQVVKKIQPFNQADSFEEALKTLND